MIKGKRCSVMVGQSETSGPTRQCYRRAVVEHDGRSYCEQHDPIRRRKRAATRDVTKQELIAALRIAKAGLEAIRPGSTGWDTMTDQEFAKMLTGVCGHIDVVLEKVAPPDSEGTGHD